MTQFTALEAARETGLSKSTITRAIKSGKLSAATDEDGKFKIDAAELFRVYPKTQAPQAEPKKRNEALQKPSVTQSASEQDAMQLRREIQVRDERIELIEEERRRERENAQTQIDDLRTRLDAEAEERRGLTRLLTTDQTKPKKRFFGLLKSA